MQTDSERERVTADPVLAALFDHLNALSSIIGNSTQKPDQELQMRIIVELEHAVERLESCLEYHIERLRSQQASPAWNGRVQ